MTALNSRLYRSASRSLRRHVTGKSTCQNSLQPITTTTRLAALQGAPRTNRTADQAEVQPRSRRLASRACALPRATGASKNKNRLPCMHACPVDSFATSLPLTCQTVPPSVLSVVCVRSAPNTVLPMTRTGAWNVTPYSLHAQVRDSSADSGAAPSRSIGFHQPVSIDSHVFYWYPHE